MVPPNIRLLYYLCMSDKYNMYRVIDAGALACYSWTEFNGLPAKEQNVDGIVYVLVDKLMET